MELNFSQYSDMNFMGLRHVLACLLYDFASKFPMEFPIQFPIEKFLKI